MPGVFERFVQKDCDEEAVMKAFQNLRRKVGAMIGGFEGGLSARRLKTFHASRAHVNTLI